MPFELGDKVKKKEHAGFVSEALVCLIPDIEDNHFPEPCFLCEDPGCREYPTLYVLDAEGNVLGSCYHVSECQMIALDLAAAPR